MENYEDVEIIIEDSSSDEFVNELNTYSYISNGLCFEYFIGYEIASLLGYKSPKDTITHNVSKSNQLFFRDYPGVKEPKLDPRVILITRDGASELLIKTRKRITPDVLHMLKELGISTTNRKCLTKEQQTLSAIANTFKTEKIEDQFKIGSYYLDMYFPEYKIVVECDENGHADRKPYKERERMDYVNKEFNIDDTHWMRYNPDEHDFDLSKVIGRIYNRIILIKKEKMEKELEEFKEQFENENKDNDSWSNSIYKNRFTSSKENITKTCRKCEKTLDINLFRNSGSSKDGHIYNCIDCDKISNKTKNVLIEGMKTCFTCKKTKSFDDFSNTTKNIDGKCSYCKECSNQKQKESKAKKGPRPQYEPSPDMKEKCCLMCDLTKPVGEFWKCKREKDGYNPHCADCTRKLKRKK
jgi:very-short-patch-repair endonuclease